MTTKLRTLKQAAFAACCAAGLAVTPAAFASSWDISVGTGPVYYNGYYYPRDHCWRDYYGYLRCSYGYTPTYYYNDGYYGGSYNGYYSPGFRVGYYHRDRDDWRWRDHRWRDGDGDRDDHRWRDHDRDDH